MRLSTNFWLGWGMALLATFANSILSAVAKIGVDMGLDPAIMLATRLIIAAAFIALTMALTRPAQLRMDPRGLLISLGAGLITGVGMLMYFQALIWVSSSIAAMIFSLLPLIVMGLLALRGEAFTFHQYVRVALGLAGVYLLIGAGGAVNGWGILLALGGATGFAVLNVSIQWFLQDYDSMTVTLYTVIGMALPNLLSWIAQGTVWHDPGWGGWAVILALALIVTYLGRVTQFIAIRHIGSAQLALFTPLETLLSVIWSVALLNEHLAFWQWLGGGLILLSAALASPRVWPARWTGRLSPTKDAP